MHLKRSITLLVIASVGFISCTRSSRTQDIQTGSQPPTASTTPIQSSETEKELERRLKLICDRANGTIGLSVVHIESGKTVTINGQSRLPLYSVFKLPLAIAVLKQVEENTLRIDQKVHVSPEELVAGTPGNDALWQKPVDVTIGELIAFSISRSDNTSTDKLLQLAGGPQAVSERLRSLGFQNLDIHATVAEFVKNRQNPNTGSADDLAKLLVQLQQGKILQPTQKNLLIGFMQKATTGLRRLRGDLPAGTIVADKTGSGEIDKTTNLPKATNDVGIITLPSGRGHLAIAVLVSESKLSDAAQEKLIAEIARAAYDFFATDAGKPAA